MIPMFEMNKLIVGTGHFPQKGWQILFDRIFHHSAFREKK